MSKKKKRPEPQTLGLPCTGVDSHAHLDMEDFREDLDQVLQQATQCGLRHIGNVFLGPQAFHENRQLFQDQPQIFFLLGIHPNDCSKFTEDDVQNMVDCFTSEPRLKAVGEIGLDYYWQQDNKELQKKVFIAQLRMAQKINKPVVIHCREAWQDTFAILDDMNFAGYPLLWHCFGGMTSQAEEILKRGWQISIPGPVTYRKNDALLAAVQTIPAERMLLETDCPFLAPEPYRGKRNEPAYTGFTAFKIAEVKNMDPAELWTICGQNAQNFFNLSQEF